METQHIPSHADNAKRFEAMERQGINEKSDPQTVIIPQRYSLWDLTLGEFDILTRRTAELEAEGIEYQAAVEKAVSEMDALTEDKVLHYAARIRNLEMQSDAVRGEAEAFEKEALRLKANAIRFEKEVAALETRMVECLPHDGKWADHRFKVSFRKSKSVDDSDVKDVSELPSSVVRVVPQRFEVNKAEAKKLLEAGEKIPGLKIVEKYSVSIK